jgi:hypothetical protein
MASQSRRERRSRLVSIRWKIDCSGSLRITVTGSTVRGSLAKAVAGLDRGPPARRSNRCRSWHQLHDKIVDTNRREYRWQMIPDKLSHLLPRATPIVSTGLGLGCLVAEAYSKCPSSDLLAERTPRQGCRTNSQPASQAVKAL